MSSLRLIVASLTYYLRLNLAVALGVATATAVVAGALVVGDSMRGSLQHLALDRLGRIDEALVAGRLFRHELVDELAADPRFKESFDSAQGAILMPATIASVDERRAAARAMLLGVEENFWQFDRSPDAKSNLKIEAGQIVVNQPLADALGAAVGDSVAVRLPRPWSIPADSPLGRKTETVASRQLKIVAIIPADGLGRFALRSSQQSPLNAFVSLETAQAIVEKPDQINAILVAGRSSDQPPSEADEKRLAEALRPKLVDYGLTVDHVQRTFEGATTHDYIQLASDQMMLSPATVDAARRAWKKYRPQESLTYLANSIDVAKSGERPAASIPYSTVTAIDPDPRFGPLSIDRQGKPIERLEAGQIVLNSWAADDLTEQGAAPTIGSEISLSFFKPESTHGRVETETTALELSAVVPLTAPDERPQPANDPLLTPELPGVTDQASIDNWDPPFPYDNTKVRSQPPNDQDEDYWRKYKTTPKAFVSLALGRTLWASRFGDTTAVRVPASEGVDRDALAKQLLDQLDPAAGGFKFQPIKRLALAASSGTTPFEGLFLGFSMFLIVAAVMLAALLFRLGMEQRADQIGLMLALGINRSRVARLLLAESTATAAIGGILGVVGGVAYAGLMIAALEWLWIDAIRAPILHLHWTWQSLGIGYAVGVLVSAGVILWSLRRMKRQSVRSLLAGQFEVEGSDHAYRPTTARYVAVGLIVVAFASAIGALQLAGEAQAGAFMASGAAALGAILSYNWMRLRGGAAGGAISAGGAPLVRLAIRNAARFPTRSALAIGLVASASFLIVSFSAFRVDPSTGGVGGFDLIAESTQPIYYDLNNAAGRDDLGLDDETSDRLSRSSVVSIRAESGDDSSCLNLYQTEQPRVLGVPPALAGREKQFDWAASLAETKPDRENPWRLLEAPLDDGALPVALDAATALYGLHKNLGDVIEIDDRRGGVIECRIVGLLKNSLFQGAVMMSEKNFLDQFPEASGYQMFLIDVDDGADSKTVASTAALVNAALADEGFFALRADARLADFLAVQNTYLSTFQSLGALGLLLGTLGLATVELRSVWQRRGELALMRAIGFRQSRLVVLVTLENAALLLAGLASGVAAALVAVVPHIFAGGANIPWTTLGGMLAAILAIGIAAGLLAVRTIVGRPLLAALRGE